MEAVTAVKLVIKSWLSKLITTSDITKTTRYAIINTLTERTVSCSMECEPILIFLICFGCTITFSSLPRLLNRIIMRETLMPPPVLPAHAPINIMITSIVRESSDHALKSTVEKPVVDISEATVNAELRSESPVSG